MSDIGKEAKCASEEAAPLLENVAFWQSKYAKVFQLGEKYFKVLRITYFERKDHEKTTFSLPRSKLLTSKQNLLQKYSNPPQILTGHSPDAVEALAL